RPSHAPRPMPWRPNPPSSRWCPASLRGSSGRTRRAPPHDTSRRRGRSRPYQGRPAAGPAPGQLPTTRPRRSRRPANGRTWLVLLQPDVFELDLHRLADMDLEPEEPLERTGLGVVVDEGARDVAVQDFGNHVAAGDDVRLVPVIDLDDLQQLVAAALERADDLRPPALRDVGELAAHGEEAAAALLVDLSGESVLGVDVALVAFQDPVAGDGAA